MYGMKDVDFNDSNRIKTHANKYNIPKQDSYKITMGYLGLINSFDSTFNIEKRNHLQPLQALYFDNNGDLISYHVNCYAGGFPNLKWNRNNNFDTFPPKTVVTNDTILSFNKLSGSIISIDNKKYKSQTKYDYNIVVFWSIRMGRQSKRLIKYVQENAELTNKRVNIIYANVDDIYLK